MFFKKSQTSIESKPIGIECILTCLYLACLPFTVVSTPYGSLLKLISIPVAVVLGIRVFMGKSEFTFNYIHFTYILYVLYTVSILAVNHTDAGIVTTKDMVLGMLMLLLLSMRIYNEQEKELMETIWILVGVVCIILALSSKETLNNYENRAVIRILGFEEDQNQFCAYFIMPMLISIKRFMERRRFYLIYIAILILSLYAILKTGSRGGLVGVLAGLLIYILLGIKSIKSRILVICAAVIIGVVVVSVIFPLLPADVQERYTVDSVVESGGTGRFEIWSYLVDYSVRSPKRLIHGSGMLSTYEIMGNAGFLNSVAHNAYIQILCDEGLIGLMLFFILIVACLIRNWGRQPTYACAFISLLAFSFSLTFYVFKPYLNIMIMCAMSFENTLPEDRLMMAERGVE